MEYSLIDSILGVARKFYANYPSMTCLLECMEHVIFRSEHVLQRQPSELSTCDHSYVNVLPQRRSATSSPQCVSPILREYASTSHFNLYGFFYLKLEKSFKILVVVSICSFFSFLFFLPVRM